MDPMRFMQEGGFGMWILLALAVIHLPVGPLALLLRLRALAFVDRISAQSSANSITSS